MRSLVIGRWAPWPGFSGSRQRSANVVAGLGALGEVDYFLLAPADDAGWTPPSDVPGFARFGRVLRDDRPVRRQDRLASMRPGSAPAAVRRAVVARSRDAFSTWLEGSYDLVWFVRIESWLALGDLVDAPSVVDYDDLRDRLLRSGLDATWPAPSDADRPVVDRLRALSDRVEASAWRRLQRRVAAGVDAVVVCSPLDRRRLGVPNAAIVPNGVDLPDRPVGRADVGRPPAVTFHGSLGYRLNTDAARLLVGDVLPRLRAVRPDATVRLVGNHDGNLDDLADVPGVTLTGRVPDITAELACADLVAVPLRQGSGTRIKIVEALAHRIPVVATSIAVDGLDVVHDHHLLVADDPDTFASACASLLGDADLRRRLADEGERLVRAEHGWEHARSAVVELATRVAGSPS